MDKGSHMVGGRTYRNILTTNEQKPTGPVEPQKLGVITTAIIPEKTKPDPEPKGTDLGKMITTHDERDVEDMSDDPESLPAPPEVLHECAETWAKKVDADFKSDLDAPATKKKAGRPKKAE